MHNIMYEKLKNYSIQSFKECLFFVFCLYCFLLLSNNTFQVMFYTHCVKCVQIRSFFWSVSSGPYLPAFGLNTERYFISPYSVRMREDTDQKKLRIWALFTQWLIFVIQTHFNVNTILQITLHVVKQSHARVSSKDICLLFIVLFLRYFSTFFEGLLLRCLIDLTVISRSSQ